MTASCTMTNTARHIAALIGRWEDARHGDRASLHYFRAGAQIGAVDELAWGGVVATIRDHAGRRHQRPFRAIGPAQQWVEDNA